VTCVDKKEVKIKPDADSLTEQARATRLAPTYAHSGFDKIRGIVGGSL